MTLLAGQRTEMQKAKRPRILLVTHCLPYPPVSGGRQRTYFLHKALSSIGDVDVLLMQKLKDPRFVQELCQHCNIVETVDPLPRGQRSTLRPVRPLAPKLVDRLATTLGDRGRDYTPDPNAAEAFQRLVASTQYDLIVGRFIRPTALALSGQDLPPVMIDVDDIDFVRYQTWIRRRGTDPLTRLLVGRHLRRVREVLPPFIRRCAHLWVASPRDLGLLDHPSISVLPNLPYPAALGADMALPPAPAASKVIAFVGIAGNRVNVEGMRRFVRRAWPIVRRAEPQATLRLAGGGNWRALAPELVRTPGVQLAGYVSDLNDVYRDAAFSIVPLFEGAGTKIKVLESLSYGRTAVVGTPSLRGYESTLHHWESLLVGEDEDDLARHCLALLKDPKRRDALAASGQRVVQKHYSFEVFERAVRAATVPLLSPQSSRRA